MTLIVHMLALSILLPLWTFIVPTALYSGCGSVSGRSFDCSEVHQGITASEKIMECNESCNSSAGSLFLPRSQGQDTAALFNPYYYLPGNERLYYATLGYRYLQTFRPNNISRCLFGSQSLHISGSESPEPGERDFLADNFGLSPNFKGSIQFSPEIKNHCIDFTTRIDLCSLNDCFHGAYIALNASVVHSIWDLRACAVSHTASTTEFTHFPECYVSDIKIPQEATGDIHTALSGRYLFGDMQSEWQFGRFELRCAQRDTGLANIDLFLGYDFLRCDDYHAGIFLKGVAPTGTRPNAERVFSPIIGNGHHWEFGGGLSTHYNLFDQNGTTVGCYIDGCVTHLFKDSQWRTFDFKSSDDPSLRGLLSRYILLKEFNVHNEYADRLINAVNFTTRKIKSSFGTQGDASLRFLYNGCGWAFGIGYNIFGRSREKISGLCDPCGEFRNKRYGIKGTSGVCAREFKEATGLTGSVKVLNATESKARAFNVPDVDNQSLVDNPVRLENTETHTAFVTWNSSTSSFETITVAKDSVKKDLPAPVFVSTNTIRIKEIPSLISHKIFAHVDYQWDTCETYQPYLGVGGDAEFAQDNRCHTCTPNQWGIWVRGGVNF